MRIPTTNGARMSRPNQKMTETTAMPAKRTSSRRDGTGRPPGPRAAGADESTGTSIVPADYHRDNATRSPSSPVRPVPTGPPASSRHPPPRLASDGASGSRSPRPKPPRRGAGRRCWRLPDCRSRERVPAGAALFPPARSRSGSRASGRSSTCISSSACPLATVRAAVTAVLPAGLSLVDLHDVWVGAPSAPAGVVAADYRVHLAGPARWMVEGAVLALLGAATLPRERRREKKTTAYDLRPLILGIEVRGSDVSGVTLAMRLRHAPDAVGRPEEVVAALGEPPAPPLPVPLVVHSIVRERVVMAGDPEAPTCRRSWRRVVSDPVALAVGPAAEQALAGRDIRPGRSGRSTLASARPADPELSAGGADGSTISGRIPEHRTAVDQGGSHGQCDRAARPDPVLRHPARRRRTRRRGSKRARSSASSGRTAQARRRPSGCFWV